MGNMFLKLPTPHAKKFLKQGLYYNGLPGGELTITDKVTYFHGTYTTECYFIPRIKQSCFINYEKTKQKYYDYSKYINRAGRPVT